MPTRIVLAGPQAGERAEAESFVRGAFESAYGARITQFLPLLMTLRADDGALLAVLGLREAVTGRLFLEQYLDRPVERLLGEAAGAPVDRASLVEVGNFAVGTAGGGRWLITALTAFLYASGRQWAVFTCGPALRNAFHRLGIELVDLADADPSCLPEAERARWGRYYDQQPRVAAASVASSHAVLSALFERECALRALWSCALSAGRLAA